jgi:hypothetical protein
MSVFGSTARFKNPKISIFTIRPGSIEPNEITDSNCTNNNINVTLGPCNPTTGNRRFRKIPSITLPSQHNTYFVCL